MLKIKGGNIAVCKAAILDKFLKRYQALYDSGRGRIDLKKHSSNCIYESVALQQESAVGNLLKKRGVMVSGSVSSPLSESPFLCCINRDKHFNLCQRRQAEFICLLFPENNVNNEPGHLEIK